MRNFLLILLIPVFVLATEYEYSYEDCNTTSPTNRMNVWMPEYTNYITLHYFSTQGWAGWTQTFGQLSNFQEELRNDYGYENVVIIAVGKSNLSGFNSNYCANSDLPLVLDEAFDYPIREQFHPFSYHKQIAILGHDGQMIGDIFLNQGLNNSAKNYILEIIEDNYQQTLSGDVNGDSVLDISDIIILIDFILADIYDENGDMNGDGGLNIQDIILLSNAIIN